MMIWHFKGRPCLVTSEWTEPPCHVSLDEIKEAVCSSGVWPRPVSRLFFSSGTAVLPPSPPSLNHPSVAPSPLAPPSCALKYMKRPLTFEWKSHDSCSGRMEDVLAWISESITAETAQPDLLVSFSLTALSLFCFYLGHPYYLYSL